jgi:REase_DpnII-MboI
VLRGSHATLDALFISSGAPGEPPALSHDFKWKEWLFRAGQDPSTDSLTVLGNILEEFMDAPPFDEQGREEWVAKRKRVVEALEADGLRYYQGGRVLPNGRAPEEIAPIDVPANTALAMPKAVQDVLTHLVRGLPRAMYPLITRRKGAAQLTFRSEYDLQDLLHALLRPWVADIRPEEFTPSYAGSSTRMDFLLPAHELVLELKLVRDRAHARKVSKELIVDIEHYAAHPVCKHLNL